MQTRNQENPEEVSRLFIGIRPDTRTQQFLDGLTSQAKRQLGSDKRDRIRWTSHANRHLTLAFLGETPDRLIPQIEQRLAQIATAQPRCSGRIVSLNPFPQRRSSLLAAELLTNPDLDKLHQSCRELMMDLGMKPERATYRPHVTLARSRRGFARLEPLMLEYTMPIDNLVLYQSHVAPGGSQYLPLFEALLGETGN
ncbi:RNA 2',3'-cyclic phosphodiesterase [Microbulbifer marinus]|uniref:RNA 2',3'-cyclic phosphodiesterase n=1 Tax=Microbulbifer marinus TaxID=658218 RepID=A0A1H3VQ55_9GAMM|nr:RNA 2',3'-cyclic phosphodiesterase [Microbulbifer marinus]SDZ76943.1 2'-5' RNA ligase [Microbulbifer marinus]